MGSFLKHIPKMGLFWKYFLHDVVFDVKSMQIAEAIGDFGLAVTHGTGLASATSDFRMHGTHQFDWRVALGEVFYTV